MKRRQTLFTFKAVQTPPCGPRAKGQRRVLIIAGIGGDTSKIDWFMRAYNDPEGFEIYSIDPRQEMGYHAKAVAHNAEEAMKVWGGKSGKGIPRFLNAALWNESGYITYVAKKTPKKDVGGPVTEGGEFSPIGAAFHRSLFNTHVRNHFPPDEPLITVPAVDAVAYLSSIVKPDDWVVFMMDVDGMEWAITERMAATGACGLVDEVYIECHNGEWLPFWPTRHSPADCHRMLNSLRAHGVYAHDWFD